MILRYTKEVYNTLEIYFDNSATTKPYKEVTDVVCDVMMNNYGNPSSLHRLGKKAEDAMTDARRVIAESINANENEIYFTSGGTECDNIAILGYSRANKRAGNRIITTKAEHAAVTEPFGVLQEEGYDVCYADLNDDGSVSLDSVKSLLNDKTILVSIMWVNNETGAVTDVDGLLKLVRELSPNAALHIDAVQGYGKVRIDVKKTKADMISLSSHKIHGPNGVGALYVADKTKIAPVTYGGHQEKNLRSGTENLAGICGFAKACEIKFKNFDADKEHISNIREYFIKRLSEIDNISINSPEGGIENILNVSFVGVKSEVLLHVLESKGIYVSTGSACTSKKAKFSHVLKEMNLKNDVIDSAIRFSFSYENTIEDIDYTMEVLKKEIPLLRKIMGKR